MASLLQRYGAPLLLLNLLRSSPRLSLPSEDPEAAASRRGAAKAASAACASRGNSQERQQQQHARSEATAALAAATLADDNEGYSDETAAVTVAEQEGCLGAEYCKAVKVLNQVS